MKLRFAKMHGLGNDFMVIDAINQDVRIAREQIQQWSHRHNGIGFDQCLIVEKNDRQDIDFFYRIFNADGSEVSQCGNGARALARFIALTGLSNNKQLRIATHSSTLDLCIGDDDRVTVDMGPPHLNPKHIPISIEHQHELYRPEDTGCETSFHAVGMGNPHAIIRVESAKQTALETLAQSVAIPSLFPQGVNVSVMQILHPSHIKLRVYERGVGETLACGSAACAAVVSGRLHHDLDEQVRVDLPGGRLDIEWLGLGKGVMMTGPAVWVFEGVIEA